LSRVDGRATDSEISLATGLGVAEVTTMLARLAVLGAVTYGNAPQPEKAPSPAAAPASNPEPVSAPRAEPVSAPRVDSIPPPPSSPPVYDAEELEEPADLDLERKRLILDAFYALDRTSHYDLLNVPPTADKKQIKRAYFQVVATFHPDKYFGKKLGNF